MNKSKGQRVCQYLKTVSNTEQKLINKRENYSGNCELVKTNRDKASSA